MSVGPPLWCRLNISTITGRFAIKFHEITLGWSDVKFGTDIPLKMNCNDFGVPLNLYLGPPSGQHLNFSALHVQC